MQIIETKILDQNLKNKICELWNKEYPKNLYYNTTIEFDSYLDKLLNPKHYLLMSNDKLLLGWALEFEREKEKWFAIIINSEFQAKGYGTKLLNKLKENNINLNGWVIDHTKDKKANGEYYKTPIPFYLKKQFIIHKDIRLETEKISAVKIVWNKNTNS